MIIHLANITINTKANEQLIKMNSRLAGLTPEALARIVKFVMRRTLLEGIRKRYAERGQLVLLTHLAGFGNVHKFNEPIQRSRIKDLSGQIATAQSKKDYTTVAKLQQRMTDMVRHLTGASSEPLKPLSGKSKATRVRAALNQATQKKSIAQTTVMRQFTGPDPFKVTADAESVRVGVGYIPVLQTIETPSATDILTGHKTSSPFRQLWLQMEYGSGLYRSQGPLGSGTPFKTGAGSWWYGSRAGQGIHFLGQQPGYFLRDRTGAPYSEDALLFKQEFARQVSTLLFGD